MNFAVAAVMESLKATIRSVTMTADLVETIEEAVASQRKILGSLTPEELLLEYARVFHEPPPRDMATGELTTRVLARFKRILQTAGS
jgi:hypothetical protein